MGFNETTHKTLLAWLICLAFCTSAAHVLKRTLRCGSRKPSRLTQASEFYHECNARKRKGSASAASLNIYPELRIWFWKPNSTSLISFAYRARITFSLTVYSGHSLRQGASKLLNANQRTLYSMLTLLSKQNVDFARTRRMRRKRRAQNRSVAALHEDSSTVLSSKPPALVEI